MSSLGLGSSLAGHVALELGAALAVRFAYRPEVLGYHPLLANPATLATQAIPATPAMAQA